LACSCNTYYEELSLKKKEEKLCWILQDSATHYYLKNCDCRSSCCLHHRWHDSWRKRLYPSGYPKAVTKALAHAVRNGKKCRINLCSGASSGPEVEEELAAVGAVARRTPYYSAGNKVCVLQLMPAQLIIAISI